MKFFIINIQNQENVYFYFYYSLMVILYWGTIILPENLIYDHSFIY